jgi:hypothetical protein
MITDNNLLLPDELERRQIFGNYPFDSLNSVIPAKAGIQRLYIFPIFTNERIGAQVHHLKNEKPLDSR